MKIALCQTAIAWEDKKQNFQSAECFIKQARDNKADMIFFPEMSFTGFSMHVEQTGETGEQKETLSLMQHFAKTYHIAIGFGWVKLAGDGKEPEAENHYSVVDDKGELLSDYVKLHPFSYGGESQYFRRGEHAEWFTYKDHTFGMSICYDLRFPELYQYLSRKADVLVVAANWPKRRMMHWTSLLKARAIENQAYLLGINCTGMQEQLQYAGGSAAYSPLGELLTEDEDAVEKETLLYVEIHQDTKQCRKDFPVKEDRRPELYQMWEKEE